MDTPAAALEALDLSAVVTSALLIWAALASVESAEETSARRDTAAPDLLPLTDPQPRPEDLIKRSSDIALKSGRSRDQ